MAGEHSSAIFTMIEVYITTLLVIKRYQYHVAPSNVMMGSGGEEMDSSLCDVGG